MILKKIAGIVILALAAFACSPEKKDIETPQRPDPTQPEGYLSFVNAHDKSLRFNGFEVTGGKLTLHLEDGKDISMDVTEVLTENCTDKDSQQTWVDEDGYWIVGTTETNIPRDRSIPDKDAYPFYIYYKFQKEVHIRISNGGDINFVYRDPNFIGAIPVLHLTTDDRKDVTSKEVYQTGTIKITNPDRTFWATEEWSATMNIRGRGNSTWGMPKKPYKVKLNSKERLFDMSNDKEWCLLANYCDKSLVRNLTAMELSRRIGFKWTPQMVPVEVYLNGRYDGVYNFCEHKKVSPERVNINTGAGDILFELESNLDEPVSWNTEHGAPVMFSEPSEPTAEQEAFAKKFFKDFETALWANQFTTVYDKYIDKKSFIDYFIIQELTKNVDGNLRKSTFLTLPKNGKLEMYFVWDFDISMGNCDYYGDGLKTWEGWWIKDQGMWGRYHGWFYHLFMDKNFVSEVKARWKELYPQFTTMPEWIEKQAEILGDAAGRNFSRWKILNTYVWPNAKVTGSYQGEVDWLLENYTKRLDWLNNKINSL